MVKTTILKQKFKLDEEMTKIVKMRATQSAIPSLSRQDRRIAEHNHERMTQEQSLQKDSKRAERIARRIAQILDQVLKDFTKIKAHLGSYTFLSSVGKDSDASGISQNDLSAAIDTRQAWKEELVNLLQMVRQYVEAQHMGNYSLLHQAQLDFGDVTCGSNSAVITCCPKVYRPVFFYYTPSGDCLLLPNSGGSSSGSANAVASSTGQVAAQGGGFAAPTNTNNYVANYNGPYGNRTRSCVLGYKTGSFSPGANTLQSAANGASSTPPQEWKSIPAEFNAMQVTNTDIELRQLCNLVTINRDYSQAISTGSNKTMAAAWWNFLFANAFFYKNTNSSSSWTISDLETHFRSTVCLPEQMIDALKDTNVGDGAGSTLESILSKLVAKVNNADAVIPTDGNFEVNRSWSGDESTGIYTDNDSDSRVSVLNAVPNIFNIEDEPDLTFVIKLICCVTENARSNQINNDREQQVIEYVRDVSECNEAFYSDVYSDMTAIDESELVQRYSVGKELCADLDGLYKETCCTKQNFFSKSWGC